MQIKMNLIPHNNMTLQEFAYQHGLVMVIHERDEGRDDDLLRYYACFENSDVRGESVLIGEYGDGDTPEIAMKDYIKHINGKVLVVSGDNCTINREIEVPILYYDEEVQTKGLM